MLKETCLFCGRAMPGKHPSNADRIRGMGYAEHGQFLSRVVSDGCPPDMDWVCKKDTEGWDGCDECWANWLRQPVKEEIR